MKRKRGWPPVIPGAAVLHSQRRPPVLLTSVCLHIHPTLTFHLSRFRIAVFSPHFTYLTLLELAPKPTSTRNPVAPLFLCLFPSPFISHDKVPYVSHDHALSPQCLGFYCTFPFSSCTRPFLDTPPHPRYPIPDTHLALLALLSYPLPLCFTPRLSSSIHLSRPTELSIHYNICYLIVRAVWFVVYLTLSFLSDVVDHGGNKTAFGYFIYPAPVILEGIFT